MSYKTFLSAIVLINTKRFVIYLNWIRTSILDQIVYNMYLICFPECLNQGIAVVLYQNALEQLRVSLIECLKFLYASEFSV